MIISKGHTVHHNEICSGFESQEVTSLACGPLTIDLSPKILKLKQVTKDMAHWSGQQESWILRKGVFHSKQLHYFVSLQDPVPSSSMIKPNPGLRPHPH